MLMRLDLALMTEAAGRMVAGKAAGLAEEDREGIKITWLFEDSLKESGLI